MYSFKIEAVVIKHKFAKYKIWVFFLKSTRPLSFLELFTHFNAEMGPTENSTSHTFFGSFIETKEPLIVHSHSNDSKNQAFFRKNKAHFHNYWKSEKPHIFEKTKHFSVLSI